MKILVTGAGGFVGGDLCRRLVADHTVLGVVRPGGRDVASDLVSRAGFHRRVLDLSVAPPGGEPVEAVLHAAARCPGPGVEEADYETGNLETSRRVLDFAEGQEVRWFGFLSAVSVYGRIATDRVDETTPPVEPDAYGRTKLEAERLIQARRPGAVILRLPVVVGGGMRSGWLYRVTQALAAHRPVEVYNPDAPYNMVHLADLHRLVEGGLARPRAGGVFTVGCRDPLPVGEIVERIRTRLGSRSPVRARRAPAPGFLVATDRAEERLGFRPTPAREILDRYLAERDPGSVEEAG